jgi:hypothetical protein
VDAGVVHQLAEDLSDREHHGSTPLALVDLSQIDASLRSETDITETYTMPIQSSVGDPK